MNKGITIVILLVVIGAMGLIMYTHTRQAQTPLSAAAAGQPAPPGGSVPLSAQSGQASPLQSPQGDNGGLRTIEPPLSSTLPLPPSAPQAAVAEGAPRPVVLTTGSDGKPRSAPAVQAPAVQEALPPLSAPTAATPALPADAGKAPTPPAADAATKPAQATPPSAPSSSGSPGLVPWDSPPEPVKREPEKKPAVTADASAPARQEKQAPLSNTGTHALKTINLAFAGQDMLLRIEAGDPFPCKTFVLTGPDRLVIDLPGTWKDMKAPSVPQNRLVNKARLGQQNSGPRLVLDLSGPLKGHKVERKGNAVEILVQ